MTDPTTEAGRALSVLLDEQGESFAPDILAIETEARAAGAAAAVERIRGNIRAVQPVKPGWGYWMGVVLAVLDAPQEEG